MADTFDLTFQPGAVLCLQTRAAPWLDQLAEGLSRLPPCRQLPQGSVRWLRLGPEEWWCFVQSQTEDMHMPQLRIAQAAGTQPHACVDLSSAYLSCVLPTAQDILSCGCDLDIERLPNDFAGRTRLAQFPAVVARTPEYPGALRLWTEASLADSLSLWLSHTARVLGHRD